MNSIINQNIDVSLHYDMADGTKKIEPYTIENLTIDDEFEIDYMLKKILRCEFKTGTTIFDFLNANFTKKEIKDLGFMGRTLVKELSDTPLLESASVFVNIMYQLQHYKLSLKKK